jgi:hypothetical protein
VSLIRGHGAGESHFPDTPLIEAEWLCSATSKSSRKTLHLPELSLSTNRQVGPEGGLYHAIHGIIRWYYTDINSSIFAIPDEEFETWHTAWTQGEVFWLRDFLPNSFLIVPYIA